MDQARRVSAEPAVSQQPPDAAAETTGASVLSGGVWKGAALTLPQLYALVQSVVAARFLGPHGMGVQSFIAFAEISVVGLLSTGLSLSLMRFTGELRGRGRPGELRDLVAWSLRLQAVGSVVAGAVLGIAALAGAEPRAAWALAAVAAVASMLHTVPSAVLIGAQRWRDASVVGLTTGAAATAGIVAVLAAGYGIVAMFAVEAVVAVVNLVWTTTLGRRALERIAAAPRVVAPEIRYSARSYALLATATSVVTFIVWRRSELFFLQHYSTSSEIAFYSIAFAFVTALAALPQSLSDVVSPAVATLFGAGDSDRIARSYGRGARLLLAVSLPLTAVALALESEVVRTIWGADYARAGTILLILIAPLPVLPLIAYARSFLTGIGEIRVPLIVMATAGVVNVALDFALIPHYDAVGAAFANVCGQLAAGLPILRYTRRKIGTVRWDVWAVLRATAVSAAAGGTAWGVVSLLSGLVGIVVGFAGAAIVLFTLAPLVKIFAAEDANWLADAVGSRIGGLLGRVLRSWGGTPAATVSGSEQSLSR